MATVNLITAVAETPENKREEVVQVLADIVVGLLATYEVPIFPADNHPAIPAGYEVITITLDGHTQE